MPSVSKDGIAHLSCCHAILHIDTITLNDGITSKHILFGFCLETICFIARKYVFFISD